MEETTLQSSLSIKDILPEKQGKCQATIKVCLHDKCCRKGAEDIYKNLKEGLSKEEALVLPIHECFGFCKDGPNISLNDNIIKGVRPFSAVELVRRELENPSCKADGLGSKSIETLDDVLENIEKL
ncbi:MAG: (2Fe-2S) ferredoxin domain-containing protein [Candidatus Moranbacteria bacterium]|nr:(2Fe-2S) ferredoxin domain-containing protein [Candidatus Moranbacteria bacterium]MDD3964897.1 (2Fe-2S) ferredoxin domain-containing protein [Candidatus Moranbacteria bacterium]